MAITRQQVFLASQFDEFAELRAALVRRIDGVSAPPLQAVDLNDNRVNERPPLHRCLGAVRRAELVVVLVGERYGSLPPHQRLSYTHLEYRTAVEEKKTVLPFFIGEAYRSKLKEFSSDLHMAKWQQEILENHTATFLSDDDPERLAEVIFDNLLVRVWELFAHPEEDRESATDADDDDGVVPDLSQLSPVGVRSLLEPSAAAGSDPAREILSLLARPTEVAAAEHAREAHRAIELGEMGGAIHHLRRALDLRPLHVARGYWLARLLVAKGTRLECNEAVRLARTAARLAQREDSARWEAAALVVAARGATRAGEADAGLGYAEQAVDVAPWHWATHLELACQHAERANAEETFRAAERAFRLRPDTISYLHHEPAVRAFGAEYDHFRGDLRDRTREQVARILQSEAACRALGTDGAPSMALSERLGRLEGLRLPELVREGRRSGESQFELLQAEADHLLKRAQLTDREMLGTLDGTVRVLNAKKAKTERSDRVAIPAVVLALVAAGAGGVWLRAAPLGTVLTVAAVLGAITFARWYLTRSQSRAEIGRRLAEAIRARDGQATEHAALVDQTKVFQAAVATFERTVLSDFLFSPRFSRQADAANECIRVDTERTEERYPGFEFQTELLPPRLALAASEDQPSARFRLFRIVGRHGNVRVASRSAAYFSPPAAQVS